MSAPAVTVVSFSYKKGLPVEAELVLDVRFLQNPYYEPTLKEQDGRSAAVGNYIMADPHYAEFFSRLMAWLLPLLPRYAKPQRHQIVIAVGCTGGRHRSVFVAEQLAASLRTEGYAPSVCHRDVDSP